MKRIAWLTDIHLNFLPAAKVEEFLETVRAARADALLVGGDIAESHDLVDQLRRLARLGTPVYFVLGNHDYYFGSIREVREKVVALCAELPSLHFLSADAEPRELTSTVGLVGHDGWADARLGDYERSLVSMNDYRLIEDLVGLSKLDRWPVLKRLGDEAADHVRRLLPAALQRYRRVLLLTHVPPLREACWHEGQVSDDHWAPHFTCQAVGAAIMEIMRAHPDRQLTVLCGHTHSAGECDPLPNVKILTGGARYCEPAIQRVFELE